MQGDSRDDKIYALLRWLAAAVWLQKQAMNRCAKGGGGLGTPAARSVFNPENPWGVSETSKISSVSANAAGFCVKKFWATPHNSRLTA